ncbi:protein EMSY-LIKE 3-like isoform X2 [Rhododendron vialii]|uniref:protein EMSY-LIKE 3-like isoform X2 n=1 Tax=Rhododendron vialii TaxID=182163 RepID=UPI00265FF6A5|nr:protein EMSY-LIKE 3-like isoform X2 [Rhododendron vialii]XP_058214437.1 protein EMSY-LIKE 3-like isoform X2 [Rhododendron vialii]
MDYDPPDSSGTDDDLPPSHPNRFPRAGSAAGNVRSDVFGTAQFLPMDMEIKIHHIEQEAYISVLRAFKAQSEAITWEKESLITELRKELRVSDEEHRDLLSRVNADDIIRRIREWRKASGLQPGMRGNSQLVHRHMCSPTVSALGKNQKTLQSLASLSLDAPSPELHPSMQPLSSALKRGPASGARGKKPTSYPCTGFAGRIQIQKPGFSDTFAVDKPAKAANFDPLIGRKVWTRRCADKKFYEAVITDYNPNEGRHALLYDINTADEACEWVNLKEMSPRDIRWDGEDPTVPSRGERGFQKSMARGGAVGGGGRGKGTTKSQSKKDLYPLRNGIGRKAALGDIEILHTDILIKEVEKVMSASQPDPLEVEKAKKVLKEQEEALVDAIARIEHASLCESADREHQFSHRRSMGPAEMEKTEV